MEIRSVGYYCPTFKTETKSALDLAPWLPVSSRLVLVGNYQLYNELHWWLIMQMPPTIIMAQTKQVGQAQDKTINYMP